MNEEYDHVVVGAGTSGSVVAARLSEDPSRRVLLLEAGPDYTEADLPAQIRDGRKVVLDEHVWQTGATVDGDRAVRYPRGRVVGGGSAINAAIALRGMPADYDEWAAFSDGVWSWDEVLPWLRDLEDDASGESQFHGVAGPIPIRRWSEEEMVPIQRAFMESARALGHETASDLNLPDSRGVGSWPMNMRGTERVSTARAYLEPARARANLTVRGLTDVERILLEDGHVVGLEARCGDQPLRISTAHVTLCSGAVGTPELLLRSGIGPADDLRAAGVEPLVDLPGVGANLLDHSMAPIAGISIPGSADPQSDLSTQVGVRFTAPGSSDPDDMQIYCTSYAQLDPALHEKIGVPYVFMVFPALVRPRSKGRVRLDPKAPQGPALVELSLLADPEDERRLVEGLRHAWQLVHTEPLASRCAAVVFPPKEAMAVDQGIAGYLRAALQPIYHPVGTARMGLANDGDAVVDAHCRVRGVKGLTIADASVMPTIPRANTNISCIMIGERVASWLRGTVKM